MIICTCASCSADDISLIVASPVKLQRLGSVSVPGTLGNSGSLPSRRWMSSTIWDLLLVLPSVSCMNDRATAKIISNNACFASFCVLTHVRSTLQGVCNTTSSSKNIIPVSLSRFDITTTLVWA